MDSLEKRRNTYEKLNYYDLITLCIKRKDKIDELKKENERLLKKSYNNELVDKINNLQSKIDKAIKYIDLKSNVNGYDKNKLLDILESKGE